VQLEDVHDAHRDLLIERFTRATVEENRLTAVGRPASASEFLIASSGAPSKTGDA
jgi:hypothetical protein